MNKYLPYFLFFILSGLSPVAADSDTTVAFRTAAFFPSSRIFRHIYENVGPCYQIEASTAICGCSGLEGWINVDLYTKKGHVRHCGNSQVHLYNSSFGPKFLTWFSHCSAAYFGLGLNIGRIQLHNRSCGGGRHSKIAWGGVLKTGFNIYLCRNLVLDLFCDYVYQRVRFQRHVNIGGIKTGLGLGIRF